jgi:hypothetical protein
LHNKGADLLAKLRSLHSITDPADGAYTELPSNLKANVSTDFKHTEIEKCVTALQGLMHLEQWNVLHDDQTFYAPNSNIRYTGGGASNSVFTFRQIDPGSVECEGLVFTNNFDPGADQNDLIFNYTYTLPAFMRLIMIFLAVCAAYEPDYRSPDNQGKFIQQVTAFLTERHDKIKGAIVHVNPPNSSDMIDPDPALANFVSQQAGFVAQSQAGHFVLTPWSHGWVPFDSTAQMPKTYPQPYGAVNLFSGYSSIGSYPLLNVTRGFFSFDENGALLGRNLEPDFTVRPVSKYLLRTLARSKAVYREIGLSEVWTTINRLKSLVSDPLLDGPSFGDWSLREVFGILGHPRNALINRSQDANLPLSVNNLADYLANSTPFFNRPSSLSLRSMLEGLPPDAPNPVP